MYTVQLVLLAHIIESSVQTNGSWLLHVQCDECLSEIVQVVVYLSALVLNNY